MSRKGRSRRAGRAVFCLMLLVLWMFDPRAFAATGYHGQVTFNGLPVPGATVTATQGDKQVVAITDEMGVYTFADLADGAWKFQVEMQGFATQAQDVTVSADAASPVWELKLLPLAEITHGAAPVTAESTPPASPAAPASGSASAPASANATPPAANPSAPAANATPRPAANSAGNTPPAAAQPPAGDTSAASNSSSSDLTQSAATGLVVNGSVNNGAASAFAQMSSFGNNHPRFGSLYNFAFSSSFDTSAWDARPYSQTIQTLPKPAYNDVTVGGRMGGILGIPHHTISQSQFYVGYQHVKNNNDQVQQGLVPTALERNGNLSQTLNPITGQPVQFVNPATNMPFTDATVPVSTQAQALLSEYPMPNVTGASRYNYQAPFLNLQTSDFVNSMVSKGKGRNQFSGNFLYQHQTGQSTNLFGFQDGSRSAGMDTSVTWQRSFRPGGIRFFSTQFRYDFNRQATNQNPYFANRTNVSGNAGISGNDQTADNWGPPSLSFSSGVQGLSDGQFSRTANQTQTFGYQSMFYRSPHTIQFGADVLRLQFNTISQQNARGDFAFTGADTQVLNDGAPVAGTGSDLADFLLGVPDTAQIAFGNADKYLRGWRYDAFINDVWRMKAGFTVNAGLRWEFSQPLTEIKDRLVNLDVAPNFTAAAPVLASDPTGSVTGQKYPTSLLHSDYRGIEPRVSIAWRPRSNSPLVIRSGYGVYDVTSVYQVIAMQMAQQPPLSKTFDLQNSAATPLTLANAFDTVPSSLPNTFGVDPSFRVGYAQIWNASVQQDLPASLTMTATYTGTKGTRLMQEYLPNTYAPGAANPCPACPLGFVYLASNANSTRQAGQVQLRRRLRDGFTATLLYTYAKAIDDASGFGASSISTPGGLALSSSPSSSSSGSASVAQNWLNLRGERGLSTFDQRNALSFSTQYTTGEGIRAGALLSGWRATFFKDWTVATTLTVGSGLPLTPIYPVNVPGTGFSGMVRPDLTGASVKAAPAGLFLNPAAYATPALGQWGDAGRDSIVGPSQFSLNASFNRVFRIGSRLNAQWETDATNVLNTVTATSWNTTYESSLFGVPNTWNSTRRLTTTIRVRF